MNRERKIKKKKKRGAACFSHAPVGKEKGGSMLKGKKEDSNANLRVSSPQRKKEEGGGEKKKQRASFPSGKKRNKRNITPWL